MRDITIVGTVHVSKNSVEEVERVIKKKKPRYVALELCKARLEALTKKEKWRKTPITEMIRGDNAYFLLAYSLLSAFERRLGEETGVKPGDEMLAGIRAAESVGAEVRVVDRPINITLKRAWAMASFREKMRILKEFLLSMFGGAVDEGVIEEMKREDVLTEMMEELARIAPSAKRVLIDERDEYIAVKIMELDDVVAVVVKGHKRGIERALKRGRKPDFAELESVPRRRFKVRWLLYGVSAAIVAVFAMVAMRSPQRLPEYWMLWSVINIVFTSIGGVIALAHPLSIAAGAIASPITSLLPVVGAGWVGGIVEAKIRKPTVGDFEALRDLRGVGDLWRNRFTHILLVAALINAGSLVGTFVALPYLLTLL